VSDLPAFHSDEGTTSEAGSAATVRVEITSSEFQSNAADDWGWGGPVFAPPDQDAIRVVEGGDGDAIVIMKGLILTANGSDDIHVDERGNGSVDLRLDNSRSSNAGLSSFGTGDVVRVTETGAGNLSARAYGDTATSSGGEFFDLRENGTGDLSVSAGLTQVEYAGWRWGYASFRLAEDDVVAGGGNLVADISDAAILSLGDAENWDASTDSVSAAVMLHEKGDGMLDGRLTRTLIWGNFSGGVKMVEEDAGNLRGTIRSTTVENGEHFGVIVDERGLGDLISSITGGQIIDNGGAAVRAGQELSGAGSLILSGVLRSGNAGGDAPVTYGSVTVTIFP
jgi:hypothetical protein